MSDADSPFIEDSFLLENQHTNDLYENYAARSAVLTGHNCPLPKGAIPTKGAD
jgi:hypothetical protein